MESPLHTEDAERAGMSTSRLRKIAAKMQSFVEQEKAAGILTAVYRRGNLVHASTAGMMDREAGKPIREDTIFRIYSMTKPITSVAIMMLYEDGHFLLTDPISKFIPQFAETKVFARQNGETIETEDLRREITIRDLLSHTAGIGYGLEDESEVDRMIMGRIWKPFQENRGMTLAEAIKILAGIPLHCQPGTRWIYSMADDVLGYIVEIVSGMPFPVFLNQRIFTPLGMVDTGFSIPEEKADRFAAIYTPSDSGIGMVRAEQIQIISYTEPVNFPNGGGGLVSTAADYLRFARLLLGNGTLDGVRLLSRKSIELMTMDHLTEGMYPEDWPAQGYGLGFGVIRDVAQTQRLGSPGTYFWNGAAGTVFWIDPVEDLIGLLMKQTLHDPTKDINYYFRILTYQAIDD